MLKNGIIAILVMVVIVFGVVSFSGSDKVSPTVPPVEYIGATPDYTEITAAQAELDAAQEELDTIQSRIAEIQGQLPELTNQETEVTATVAALQTELQELLATKSSLETQIIEVKREIASLTTSLEGYQLIAADATLDVANENAGFYSTAFKEAISEENLPQRVIFNDGRGVETKQLSEGRNLVQIGVPFDYCGMTLKFVEENNYLGIEYQEIGFSEASAFDVLSGSIYLLNVFRITEDQVSKEILDLSVKFPDGVPEKIQTFVLFELDANGTYCSDSGEFLSSNFKTKPYEATNIAKIGSVDFWFYLNRSSVHDLRGQEESKAK